MNLELFKLRFVGVIRFVLHVLQVFTIGFYTTEHVLHLHIYNKASTKFGLQNRPSPYLVMVCMLVDSLIKYFGPPDCDHY